MSKPFKKKNISLHVVVSVEYDTDADLEDAIKSVQKDLHHDVSRFGADGFWAAKLVKAKEIKDAGDKPCNP